MEYISLRLQQILNAATDDKKVFGTSFALKQGDFKWEGASGNLALGQPYFIASTTKLFTTALIMQLRAEGRLHLEDGLSQYLNSEMLKGLHVYKNRDYSSEIRVRHLLAHTSGLPDYFQDKGKDGVSLENQLKSGTDRHWTLEQALEMTRTLKPHFPPGTPNKAFYSDTNFQLLGRIIEQISGMKWAEACTQRIIDPLSLKHTYPYQDPADQTPAPLYYQKAPLHIPLAMSSFGPDGGMVSTSSDMLCFIEAFFTGHLFPLAYIEEMQQWNRIFFPMQSGMGIHRFKLPWFFNPTGAVPEYIGHSGLSGALAFYAPSMNLFITGTVNQVAHPDVSFRTMIKLTQEIKKMKR